MKHFWLSLVAAIAVSPLAAAQDKATPTLVHTLEAAGNFTTYLSLQDIAGFRDLGLGPVQPARRKLAASPAAAPRTFLVPNDAAFAKMPAAQLDALKRDPAQARAFLLLHSLPGTVKVADMFLPVPQSKKQFASVGGSDIEITCSSHTGMHYPWIRAVDASAASPASPAAAASIQDNGLRKPGTKAGIQDDGLHAGMVVNAGRARVGKFQDVVVAEGVVHEIDGVLWSDAGK